MNPRPGGLHRKGEGEGEGELDPARLASYQRLVREAERLDERLDPTRRHELRARERSFGKMVKQVKRIKGGG